MSQIHNMLTNMLLSDNKHATDVQQLIDICPDLNRPTLSHASLLHLALTTYQSFEVIRRLVIRSDLINLPNAVGNRPLHQAIISRHGPEVINYLIGNGVDMSLLGFKGNTYLHTAINTAASDDVIDIFIDEQSVNHANYAGRIAIHAAVFKGASHYIFSKILALTHDVNASDLSGNTALHYAVLNNNTEIFTNQLLTAGANCDLKNELGDTPLHIILSRQGSPSIAGELFRRMRYLNENNNGDYPLGEIIDISIYLVDFGKANLIVDSIETCCVCLNTEVKGIKIHEVLNSESIHAACCSCINELRKYGMENCPYCKEPIDAIHET